MSLSETCPKCRKPTSGGGGSITQWIAVCKCNELASQKQTNKQESQTEPTQICRTCGKHIGEGRSGSFTQYIFRHDLCKCAKPEPESPENLNSNDENSNSNESILNANPKALNANQKAQKSKTAGPPEDELSLDDPDKFPLQRYKPLSLLGRGAAGSVYLCRDRLLGKKVAVKTLNKLTADQLVSFQLEAKAVSRVNHPYIITVLDFGATESGYPFMVMEYVSGTTLAQLLEEHGALETDLAIEIGIKICDALECIHKHKMFHRDLKPSNILLVQHDSDDDFGIRLIDFGIAQAKFDTQEPTIFQGRTVVGTPNYMSPDQVSGKRFDARSEVYSFGCVLFELLTGTPPFVTQSALETLSKHAHEAPPALSNFGDQEFPENLEVLVAKCLKKKRGDRYQSMAEVGEALAALAEKQQPFPPSAATRSEVSDSKSANQSPITGFFKVLIGLLILAFIAIVGMAIVEQSKPIVAHKRPTPKSRDLVVDILTDKLTGPINGKLTASIEFADEDMKSILKFKDVTQLSLARSLVTGKNLSILEKLPLELLDLSNTKVNDQSMVEIVKLSDLKELKLNYDAISDQGVKRLSLLRDLRNLALDRTQITDSGLDVLAQLPNLKILSIVDCPNVTGIGLGKLAHLKSLQRLHVSASPWISQKDFARFKRTSRCELFVTLYMVPPRQTITKTDSKGNKTNSYGIDPYSPVFQKFLKYKRLMYNSGFTKFFRNPQNWNLGKSDIAKVKDRQILECLNDRDYMQDLAVKQLWLSEGTWRYLKLQNEASQSSYDMLMAPESF